MLIKILEEYNNNCAFKLVSSVISTNIVPNFLMKDICLFRVSFINIIRIIHKNYDSGLRPYQHIFLFSSINHFSHQSNINS